MVSLHVWDMDIMSVRVWLTLQLSVLQAQQQPVPLKPINMS